MCPRDIRYHRLMSGAVMSGAVMSGFVLAGGRSSRMGRDKALLPVEGGTLVEQIAGRVLRAAGNVTIIGYPVASPGLYASLGYPVVADRLRGYGPLGGVYTALSISHSDWNLIVACDMPAVTVDFLDDLLQAAKTSRADCVVPQTAGGLDPLCAVYHRRCVDTAASAIERKTLKMQDFVSLLRAEVHPVSDSAVLENVNTPEQWSER